MSITINVNQLSLVHKGSNGMTAATLPDVCKTPTPGGPVPLPYPNISFTTSLSKGTQTVKADGGHMIAHRFSQFSTSIGDEPGVLGGVTSGTFKREAKWLSWSADVKIEGNGACRLTDKMTCNHGNTVSLGGEIQALVAILKSAGEWAVLCEIICYCKDRPVLIKFGRYKQKCVERQLLALDDAMGGQSNLEPEVPYNMIIKGAPPKPMMSIINPRRGATNWMWPFHPEHPEGFIAGKGHVRRVDVAVRDNPALPPSLKNLLAIVEIKFPPDPWDSPSMIKRRADYQRIASENNPDALYVELDPEKCQCNARKPELQPQDIPVYAPALPKRSLQEGPLLPLIPLPLPAPGAGINWDKVTNGLGVIMFGLAISAAGYGLASASTVASGALLADDVTVVGVFDDPLLLVTGAGIHAGRSIAKEGATVMFDGLEQMIAGFSAH